MLLLITDLKSRYQENAFLDKFSVLAGGRCPPDRPNFDWGGKAPPDPPLKWSFVTFDRGGQTGPPRSNAFFFGAVDDTGAVDGTGAADNRPTSFGRPAVRRPDRPKV